VPTLHRGQTTGSLLPLLLVESTTGPAVGGTRAAVTLQRLRLEVEPTFLLDVGRVFVPSLAGGGGEAPEEVLPKAGAAHPRVWNYPNFLLFSTDKGTLDRNHVLNSVEA
jgi:hypothetical protein